MKKFIITIFLISNISYLSLFSFSYGIGINMSKSNQSKDISGENDKILIEHIGWEDYPISPILIKCGGKIGNKSVMSVMDFKEVKQWTGVGYHVFLKSDEFDAAKKIIKSHSKEDTGIRDKSITDFGTFYYTFFHDFLFLLAFSDNFTIFNIPIFIESN